MALKKIKKVKGIDCEYWVVSSINWDKNSNQTQIALNLYKDKSSREQSLNNCFYGEGFTFDGQLTIEQVYTKIKESKLVKNVIVQGVEELIEKVYDEETNSMVEVITPKVEEQFEMVETNWFVDSEDC
jgi:hypothetical protein